MYLLREKDAGISAAFRDIIFEFQVGENLAENIVRELFITFVIESNLPLILINSGC